MIVLKIQIDAALYRKLWKCVSVTQVSVSIYPQKWTLVCIWYAVFRIRGVGFFGWWRLRGSCILKGIKRTSSSAPSMEKHDILHSWIKKLIVGCLRWFLWSYCNEKCPERIIYPMWERIKCANINLSARRWIPSLSQKTDALSIGQTYMRALKKYLLSWV